MYSPKARDNTENQRPAETSMKVGFRNRLRTGNTQAWTFTFGFILIATIAVFAAMLGAHDDVRAQSNQLPPQLAAVIFDGRVTVAGSPLDLQGLTLIARVGDWTSEPVTLGDGTPDLNGFEDLTVNPPSELLGQEVRFILGGSVEATTTDYYADIAPDGTILRNNPIVFPVFRTVMLDFPSYPETTTPTEVPAVDQPDGPMMTVFSGQAFAQGAPVPDGYEIFAVVGNTPTDKVTVVAGTYSLVVNTSDNSLNGAPITFFLVDKGDPTNPSKTLEAETSSVFTAGESAEISLVFPALAPTPIPEPTATPVPPTATPEPPTATPVPPTATPIPPTATPVPPTATPVPPTATPVPPTATPEPPTATPVPPTATPIPPTATPEPTATPVPPTATPIPPTATPEPTATPVPPTATPIPPTATPVPPTAVPPTVAPEPEDTGGGFNATIPLAIVLVLLLIAIAAYFGWRYTQQSKEDA